jgi:hypothetical protein
MNTRSTTRACASGSPPRGLIRWGLFEASRLPIRPSAWEGCDANFAQPCSNELR